jgi:hypothetical protein
VTIQDQTDIPITIPGRFNGPPGSGNGGYVAGTLAAVLDSTGAVTVRLRVPPPLDHPMTARRTGGEVTLLDGERTVATAAPAHLALTVPAAPDLAAAAAAAAAVPPRVRHPFPTCFGCGPDRPAGEGIGALLGPLPQNPQLWAGTWRPGAQLPHADGQVTPEMMWAALDCPSAQPIAPDDGPAHVLGTFTAQIDGLAALGTDHVLLAWGLGKDGRKSRSASAVLDVDGRVLARAEAVWIALPNEQK